MSNFEILRLVKALLRLVQALWQQVPRLFLSAASLMLLFALPAVPAAASPAAARTVTAESAAAGPPACVLSYVDQGFPPGPVISANGNYILYSKGVDVPNYGSAPHYFVYNRTNKKSGQVSLNYQGQSLANDDSYGTPPAISDNGRLVVFFFRAKNMLPGESGDMFQLYARDQLLNTLEIVSQSSAGVESNAGGWTPALSTDGRYVAFQSPATNLTPDDTNSFMDTFVRDRKLGTTERVSIASDGSQGDYSDEYGFSSVDISGDGRYVAFNSTNLKGDDGVVHSGIFLRDRQEKRTYWIAQGYDPVMTPDARYMVFESGAQLTPNDQSTSDDLYLYDRSTGAYELLTVGPNGKSENDPTVYTTYSFASLSADAGQVVFATQRSNLVTGDTNQLVDIFVRDRTRGVTERLSISASGQESNLDSYSPSISADGRYVTFSSGANNLLPNTGPGIYLCQRVPAAAELGFTLHLPLLGHD